MLPSSAEDVLYETTMLLGMFRSDAVPACGSSLRTATKLVASEEVPSPVIPVTSVYVTESELAETNWAVTASSLSAIEEVSELRYAQVPKPKAMAMTKMMEATSATRLTRSLRRIVAAVRERPPYRVRW